MSTVNIDRDALLARTRSVDEMENRLQPYKKELITALREDKRVRFSLVQGAAEYSVYLYVSFHDDADLDNENLKSDLVELTFNFLSERAVIDSESKLFYEFEAHSKIEREYEGNYFHRFR